METILITGPYGFVASHLFSHLVGKFRLVGIKRSDSDRSDVKYDSLYSFKDDLEVIFERENIDYVVNLATCYLRSGEDGLSDLIDTNINLPIELARLSIKFNSKLFINIDSFFSLHYLENQHMEVYTNSKRFCFSSLKEVTKDSKLKLANLYLHHVYGLGDKKTKFIPWITQALSTNSKDPIKLTAGLQKRDFVHVNDVCRAILTIIESYDRLDSLSVFEIGTGQSIHLKTFILELKEQLNSHNALAFGAIVKANDINDATLKNDSIFKLGWKPEYDYRKGIASLING